MEGHGSADRPGTSGPRPLVTAFVVVAVVVVGLFVLAGGAMAMGHFMMADGGMMSAACERMMADHGHAAGVAST